MGRNKALLKIGDLTLIERVLRAVPDRFRDRAIVVTNSPEDYDFIPNIKIGDIKPGLGPISGIHAGLSHVTSDVCFFLACDFPFITSATIELIIRNYSGQEILGATTGQRRQPLCAIYSERILPVIEKQIESTLYSLQEMIARTHCEWLAIESEETLFNLNTLDEYKTIIETGAAQERKEV